MNKSIRAIDLSENNIGDRAVEGMLEVLKSNKKLKFLNLTSCGLTEESVNSICPFLQQKTNLAGFKAGHNSFNPTMGELVGLVLQENQLVSLDLRFCKMNVLGTFKILEGLKKKY